MGKFTIISLCGGGIRGLLSARILERLAKVQPNLIKGTTLYAGTSTGSGIIGMLLANKSPSDICDYYLKQEVAFFNAPVSKESNHPRYDVAKVALGVELMHGHKTLGDYKQKVALTAWYVGGEAQGKPAAWAPRLYTNLARSGTPTVTVVDAVTQSSAMPGMMGSWKGCVDGAFVNHDPSIAAIALALENGAALEDIALIDIGTGLMPDWITDDTHKWGAAQWIGGGSGHNVGNRTPPFFLNWHTPTPALDMALSGPSAELTPLLVHKMLGNERYINLNPHLDWYIPEDSTSKRDLDELQLKAREIDLGPALAMIGRYWA
jgi:patatin-like phospholipase/acyl hydrolase